MRLMLIVLGLLVSSLCFADLTLVQRENNYDGTDVLSTTYFTANMTATRDSLSGNILDFGNRRIILLDMVDKSFCQASLADYHTLAVEFAEKTNRELTEQRIQELMSYGSTREEAEEAIRSVLAMNRPDSTYFLPVEAVKGETKKIAGFSADAYLLRQQGEPVRLVWISGELQQRVDREIPADLAQSVKDELALIGKDMQKTFTGGIEIPDGSVDSTQAELEKQGYTMAVLIPVDEGKLALQSEIIEIIETPVDPGLFQIPAGFREVTIAEMFMNQYQRSQE